MSIQSLFFDRFRCSQRIFILSFSLTVTLMLSFALFPKESNWKYAVGSVLVLGGLTVASLDKQRRRNQQETFEKMSDEKVQSIDTKLLSPLSDDPSETAKLINYDEDREKSEYKTVNVELGRSLLATSGNGPGRRR